MDPVTAALTLANTLSQIVLEAMKGQSPEVREKLWNRHIAQLEKWDGFWQQLFTRDGKPPKP